MRVGRFFAVFGSEKRYFRINNLHEHTCIISRTVMQILFQVFFGQKALDLFDDATHILHFSHGFELPTNHV